MEQGLTPISLIHPDSLSNRRLYAGVAFFQPRQEALRAEKREEIQNSAGGDCTPYSRILGQAKVSALNASNRPHVKSTSFRQPPSKQNPYSKVHIPRDSARLYRLIGVPKCDFSALAGLIFSQTSSQHPSSYHTSHITPTSYTVFRSGPAFSRDNSHFVLLLQ